MASQSTVPWYTNDIMDVYNIEIPNFERVVVGNRLPDNG